VQVERHCGIFLTLPWPIGHKSGSERRQISGLP
jgi:hypothetical protein